MLSTHPTTTSDVLEVEETEIKNTHRTILCNITGAKRNALLLTVKLFCLHNKYGLKRVKHLFIFYVQ